MKKCYKIILIFMAVIFVNNNVSAATVRQLLSEAVKPIGKCLYVYGGGWNETDDGAGIEAVSLGLGENWENFYNINSSNYNCDNYSCQIHNGLDCTGYVGWTMYQLFQDTYSSAGYVFPSKILAERYSSIFGGEYVEKEKITDYRCGDIMSCDGHTYIVIGQFEDGSVMLLHASPPCVTISGTYAANGDKNSKAVKWAAYYMDKYFHDSFLKYPNHIRNTDYLTDYNQMIWNNAVLKDSDGYRDMSPDDILWDLFENLKIYAGDRRIAGRTENKNGTVYIPVRALSGGIGAEVLYRAEEETVILNKDGKSLELYPHKGNQRINSYIKEGVAYVPIREICEFFGYTVVWNDESKSILIGE